VDRSEVKIRLFIELLKDSAVICRLFPTLSFLLGIWQAKAVFGEAKGFLGGVSFLGN